MTKNWTQNQTNAINTVGGTVLVSAAAGSGKTAVLVQRVINRVVSIENHIDIDKFLIITFTQAAANEMRSRIYEELYKLSSRHPLNSNLIKQKILLKNANICTIDSFCNKLVKENFYKLGILPKFRILDENEVFIIKELSMDIVLEKYYAEKKSEFIRLANIFSDERNDDFLASSIDKIYEFASVFSYPQKWFDKTLSNFRLTKKDPKNTPWGEILINFSKKSLKEIRQILKEILNTCQKDENIKKGYFNATCQDLTNIDEILNLFKFDVDYSEILSKIQNFSFKKFGSVRGTNSLKNEILIKRAYVKEILKKIKTNFCFSEEYFLKDIENTFEILKMLLNVVQDFGDEYENQKKIKNTVTFNDLEHMALKLLINEGKRTQLACELSCQFEEIIIDEYQDINELQESIFSAISKHEKNIFMVGDIKQSIYKFRRANPQIFIEKKTKFNFYNLENTEYPTKIFLDKNFRSREEILEFVNSIFKNVMTKQTSEIEYNTEEYLLPGSNFSPNNDKKVEIKLLEIDEKTDQFEAQEIANAIKNMIESGFKIKDGENERPVDFKDFCILLRSYSDHASVYEKKLKELGIPAISENSESFFDNIEIACIFSVLRVVDNPIQDIPLISALMSPAFGFTTDDVAKIRSCQDDVPFYFALKKAAEEGNEKCENFVKKINHYRDVSAINSCEKLINYIYEDTNLLVILKAMPNGENRQKNLFLFLEYAVKYEDKAFKNLSGFIRFMNNIEGKKIKIFGQFPEASDFNNVKIMSIHKSKGLEFSVCFIAGCFRKFNNQRDNLLVHEDLGIGVKLKSMGGSLSYNTAIRQAILIKMLDEDIAEQLRVFYVALTRAKEKLVLVMSCKNAYETVDKVKALVGESKKISTYYTLNSKSFSQWIIACAVLNGFDIEIKKIFPHVDDIENKDLTACSLEKKSQKIDLDENLVWRRLNFKYPDEDLKNVPLKIAASLVFNENEWINHIASLTPNFANTQKINSAQKGTAVHKFLYFADFKNSFESEFEHICQNKLLSESELKILDKNILKKFFKSEICQKIKKSKKILKEHRFMVSLPAIKFYKCSKNKKIVVQGAVDLVFENEGEYIIVDYKTDKVNNVVELFEKYKNQIKIYKLAFEESENLKVRQVILYSLWLGEGFIT